MLAKRKFQNFVNTYGDQSISGQKTFTENLVVTGECTLPDSVNITLGASTIPQSSIISTTGWIKNSISAVENVISDAIDNIYNLFLTKETAEDTYATKNRPHFFWNSYI